VALTRSRPVLATLRALARRVVAHDPAPPRGGEHASLWLARPLVPQGVDTRADPPPLAFTAAERRAADALARELPVGFVAVHPGSGSTTKNWPRDRFAEAARGLAPHARWLLVLGPAEEGDPGSPGALAARGWRLRDLAALLSRAGLFLGNDSGVTHLAAAAGAPTLALHGPTDPALWAPVGPVVGTCRAPGEALADLAVGEVVAAARALASTSRGSEPPSGR
jgi:heptosyltransferase III